MIIKSTQREGWEELEVHLESDENEKVRVVKTRGVILETIGGALEEFEAIAKASNCKKFMFHVSASPHPNESMTEKQWLALWKQHERINNLENAAYIEIEHDKNGRIHRHRVYCRVNSDTGKAVNLSWTRLKNERLSRMCEAHFGHKIVQGKFNRSVIKHLKKDGFKTIAAQLEASGIADNEPRITQITHSENQQIRNGFDLKVSRGQISDAWAQSDNADAFKAALVEKGYYLADGDKQGVPVVLDVDGHVIPLLRAINAHRKLGGLTIIKKKEFMKKVIYPLKDVDAVKEQLPEPAHFNNSGQKAKIKKDLPLSMSNIINQQDKISGSNKILSSRKSDKKNLLDEEYGELLASIHLTRFWQVDRLSNGWLQLQNRTGTVIDRGDNILVNTINNQQHAITAALELAKLKGWDEIIITGDDEFKTVSYEKALEMGIKVDINNEHDRLIYERVLKNINQHEKNVRLDIASFPDQDEEQENNHQPIESSSHRIR